MKKINSGRLVVLVTTIGLMLCALLGEDASLGKAVAWFACLTWTVIAFGWENCYQQAKDRANMLQAALDASNQAMHTSNELMKIVNDYFEKNPPKDVILDAVREAYLASLQPDANSTKD